MSTNDEADIGGSNAARSGALKEEPQVASGSTPQGFSIDDIMWRVRAEVKRRRNGHVGVAAAAASSEIRSFDLSMASWVPAVPRLPVKDNYHISELLAYSDADFVDTAHRAIYRRPPDEAAFNHFLLALRGGGMTKMAIIQAFMMSAEAQSVGVRIDGMYLPALLESWRGKRFIGPIITWAHALLRLEAFATRQAAMDAYRAQEIQELGRLVNEGTERLAQRIAALKVEFAGRVKSDEFEALKSEHANTKLHVARLETEVGREIAERPDGAAFAELKQKNASAMSQLSNLEAEVRAKFQLYEEHLNRLEGSQEFKAGSLQQLLSRDEQAAAAIRALDPFYAAFEDHFRGDRAVIRTRVEPYLDLVREVGAGTREAPVVDIGCGRGEWLELIRDCGLIGQGIEINRVFVDFCRGLGLEIMEGEAVQSLRAMPEGSVGAITAMHVIEHLPFEHAIALLDEMHRVLRPGGLLIVETPNPENLSVGHLWFYMDPTHRNPLPPEALRWIVEARGFHEVRIERLVLARELNVPPPLAADAPGADAVNTLLASMRVAADYAIVAKRS